MNASVRGEINFRAFPCAREPYMRKPSLLFETGAALFVDARPRMIYDLQRIPGALSLPEDDFDAAFAQLAPRLRNRFDVIVYCSGFGCEASHIVARKLKERGIPAVVLEDGIPAWQDAGYPLQERTR